jgi:hypothetical protein
MVARESKSSPDDFTKAGPSIQLDAKQCRDASILNLQVASVFPQELRAIKLLPECLVTTRKAARNTYPQVNYIEILKTAKYMQCIFLRIDCRKKCPIELEVAQEFSLGGIHEPL